MTTPEAVKEYLQTKFHQASEITVTSEDLRHYHVSIKSFEFANLPLVKQHQLVLNELNHYLESQQIHAFKIHTDVA
ncbi:BolA/IbaG family iron-sulfur metabolism protein [Candidatus Gracilibacteria bacterium]|jgi:acid stress-induced BolA-like protein IbaG/YrbA|nr:BolA/IbaG family iron-sulfur metabolism protein [Candidatus Gracilibacteria bacterium]